VKNGKYFRAVRYGTLGAAPTTTPPKPAEATLGFSSNRKGIDKFPGPVILLGPEKKVV
jgi:hypothetical protein